MPFYGAVKSVRTTNNLFTHGIACAAQSLVVLFDNWHEPGHRGGAMRRTTVSRFLEALAERKLDRRAVFHLRQQIHRHYTAFAPGTYGYREGVAATATDRPATSYQWRAAAAADKRLVTISRGGIPIATLCFAPKPMGFWGMKVEISWLVTRR